MSFFHHAATGAFVPALVKKMLPYTGKIFGVDEIDAETQKRVEVLQYPRYYGVLYAVWMIILIVVGLSPIVTAPLWGSAKFPEIGPLFFVLFGICSMIGALSLVNGLINAFFWRLSSLHFRDYVRLRLIKSGAGYVVEQQIAVMIKIGTMYSLVLVLVVAVLIFGFGVFINNGTETPSVIEAQDITKGGALEKIRALPEVNAFVSDLAENGKEAVFGVEDRGDDWSVQVYEIVVRGGESHTATFNWYRVDKSTGAIAQEFE